MSDWRGGVEAGQGVGAGSGSAAEADSRGAEEADSRSALRADSREAVAADVGGAAELGSGDAAEAGSGGAVEPDSEGAKAGSRGAVEPDPKGAAGAGEPEAWPAVSVVMPVLNEERHLAEAVEQVLEQDYPGGFELVLAVGPSKDQTERIAGEIAAANPRVTVVPNPSGQIASAMNAAVKAARHDVITRIDGHALLPARYLRTAVRTLLDTGASDVGGVMAAEGETPFQRAVAWAMTSPAGVGAAANHTGGQAGPADTVYLGVYRREAIERAGGYDESMLVAEDWELNYRIRAGGGLIWFTPDLRVTYRPRASVPALARQHFRYGRWRRVVARRHPETVNLRYLAAPVAAALNTLGLLAGAAGVGGVLAQSGGPVKYLTLGFVIPALYLGGVTAVTVAGARDLPAGVRARVPVVLATMHMCWGMGFLTSPRRLARRDNVGHDL
ncbi:MAG: glycosyltransferase family 2 protein [Nocardiopsaceae bacterium]|nr:glycosyltransferase family 2 protein [Nocardiopsaceae bacterium]